jgi:hypothetical protein
MMVLHSPLISGMLRLVELRENPVTMIGQLKRLVFEHDQVPRVITAGTEQEYYVYICS